MQELAVESVPDVKNVVAKPAVKAVVPFDQGEESGCLETTLVSTLDDLKEVSPQVYKAMMEGIATNIVNEMRAGQERIKKIMRQPV